MGLRYWLCGCYREGSLWPRWVSQLTLNPLSSFSLFESLPVASVLGFSFGGYCFYKWIIFLSVMPYIYNNNGPKYLSSSFLQHENIRDNHFPLHHTKDTFELNLLYVNIPFRERILSREGFVDSTLRFLFFLRRLYKGKGYI